MIVDKLRLQKCKNTDYSIASYHLKSHESELRNLIRLTRESALVKVFVPFHHVMD